MTSSATIVSITNVSKHFRDTVALKSVSLEVRRGEMIGLIGPSGSGKSTLLRAMAGLVVVDQGAGRIIAFDHVLQSGGRLTPMVRQTRRRMGFIFQQFNLVGRLSLFTNVALGSLGRVALWRGLLGRWPHEIRRAAMNALKRVGIVEMAAQRANTLSGGQQQRGAIARTLVQEAEIILADEPVASLDPVSARRVMDILRDLNSRDRLTVLVTLHQVDFAMRYCDRVVALKAGRVVYDGSSHGLSQEILADVYGPEFQYAVWDGEPT